jgi:hypothetical protein
MNVRVPNLLRSECVDIPSMSKDKSESVRNTISIQAGVRWIMIDDGVDLAIKVRHGTNVGVSINSFGVLLRGQRSHTPLRLQAPNLFHGALRITAVLEGNVDLLIFRKIREVWSDHRRKLVILLKLAGSCLACTSFGYLTWKKVASSKVAKLWMFSTEKAR